jgi:hypothetical protein
MSNPNDRHSNALVDPPPNSAELTEAFKILAQADTVEVPKVPEQLFIEHLLPMLSAPAGTKVDLTKWLDVAGTPIRPIDVVDNFTGEALFRLPALMRTLPTAFQEEMRYAEIVMDAQARETSQHAIVAERYLGQQLGRARTGATLLDVETAKTWNNIRVRYGLPLLEVVGQDGKLIPVSGASAPASSGALSVSDDQDDFL